MLRASSLLVLLVTACSPETPPSEASSPVTNAGASTSPTSEASPSPHATTTPNANATPTSPAAAGPNASPAEAAAPAPANPRKATSEQAVTLRHTLRSHLDAGRKASKDGNYPLAIAELQLAREIEPSDARVLGELGWAAFKANQLALARASTMQATRSSGEPKQLGALLYNLGRIHEAEGDDAGAIDAYRLSLSYRDNQTVKKRLAELEARAGDELEREASLVDDGAAEFDERDEPDAAELAAARPSDSALSVAHEGLASIATLADLPLACTTLVEKRCADFSFGGEACTCAPTLLEAPSGASEAEAGLLVMHVGPGDAHRVWYPVVHTSAGWVLFREIAWAYSPGTIGVWETITFGETRREAELGDAIVFSLSKGRADSDMANNELEEEQYDAIVICEATPERARCTLPIVTRYAFERDVEFPESPGEQLPHDGLPIVRSYAAELSFGGGKLDVRELERKALELGRLATTGAVLLPIGKHALTKLLG